jgi:GntR family transcriptional regulator
VTTGLRKRDQIRERYGIISTEAEQIHEASAADTMAAALLGIDPGSPVLILERATRDQHGTLFECTRAVYRGDRYRVGSKPAPTEPQRHGRSPSPMA